MNYEPLRVVSIDPGTFSAGVSLLEIYDDPKRVVVVDSVTLELSKLAKKLTPDFVNHFGERTARLLYLREAIERYTSAWKAHCVISEAPYMGRHVSGYTALVEACSAIQSGVTLYDPMMMVIFIDPASIKKNLGVSGNSGDKEKIKTAVKGFKSLSTKVDLDTLSEHAIDSIAVGLYYFNHFHSDE